MEGDLEKMLEDVDLFDEAYYGKIPDFVVLEKLFEKIDGKVKAEGANKANPNKYPEMRQVEDIFCKVFGFKRASIYWEPFIAPNAYTYSMNTLLVFSGKKKYIEKTGTGFYDNSKSTTLAVFTSMGLYELGLTPREMIAVILHEIGHNFDFSFYQRIEVFIDSFFTLGIYAFELNKYKEKVDEMRDNAIDEISGEDDAIYHNQKRRDRMKKEYEKMMGEAHRMATFLNGLKIPFNAVGDLLRMIVSPFAHIGMIGSKKGELFADSFAAAYGYGPDLISGLNKLDNVRDRYYINKTPVGRFINDLTNLHWEIYSSFSDCHGTNQERCQECIEKLKWDLKHNDFPPELKQDIINQINDLTAKYKAYTKWEPKDRYKISKVARKINAIIFRGRPNILKFFARNKV